MEYILEIVLAVDKPSGESRLFSSVSNMLVGLSSAELCEELSFSGQSHLPQRRVVLRCVSQRDSTLEL